MFLSMMGNILLDFSDLQKILKKFIKGLEKYIDQEVVKIVNPRKKKRM